MKKRGFTLLELILSLAIASILILTLSLVLGSSLKINKQLFANELTYKDSIQAMAYMENMINKAYKIEEVTDFNNECNFKLYVIDAPESSGPSVMKTYRFRSHLSAEDKKTYFSVEVSNQLNNSRSGKFRVARCDKFKAHLDKKSKTVKIIINPDSPQNRYESLIYVGNKL